MMHERKAKSWWNWSLKFFKSDKNSIVINTNLVVESFD